MFLISSSAAPEKLESGYTEPCTEYFDGLCHRLYFKYSRCYGFDTGWGPSWVSSACWGQFVIRPPGCPVLVGGSFLYAGHHQWGTCDDLMPALIPMASQIQYMGRLLGLADVPKKYWPLLMVISIFNAFIGKVTAKLLYAVLN